MAGIPDSALYYYFDESGEMYSIVYDFGSHDYSSYSEIGSLIRDKYSWMKADNELKIASNLVYFYDKMVSPLPAALDDIQIELSDGSRILISHMLAYTDLPGYSKDELLMFGGKHYLEYRFSSFNELKAVNGAIEIRQQREEENKRLVEEEQERQRNEDI